MLKKNKQNQITQITTNMTTWHTCYPNIAISNDTSHHRRSGHNLESNISPRTRGWNCERCNRCTSLFHLWVLVSMSYTLAHPTSMMRGVFIGRSDSKNEKGGMANGFHLKITEEYQHWQTFHVFHWKFLVNI